jgi:site-specific DNA-methyltransferase (adenine-specific)
MSTSYGIKVINNRVQEVPVAQIDEGKRYRQDYGDMEELIGSVRELGVIQSIAVMDKAKARERGEHDFFESDPDKPFLLLAGGRRTRAAQEALLETIPAVMLDYVATEEEVRTIELVENIHRKDLEWHEKDALIREIHRFQVAVHGPKISKDPNAPGHSMRDTAKLLNMSPSKVSQAIKMADAVELKPELKTTESRREAEKALEREELRALTEELSRRHKERLGKGIDAVEKEQKRLVDAYILKSFFEGVENVPNGSIDFVEIDPPYGIELVEQKKGWTAEKYEEVVRSHYETFMRETLSACYRAMKNHSWGICWFGPEPWAEPMYQWIIDSGFTTDRLWICWAKGGGQTRNPAYKLGNGYELAFYFRKGTPGIVKQGRSNLYAVPPVAPTSKKHPTERPLLLIQQILETFCNPGARVMVPFLGSGKTIMSASNAGMDAFGFDIVESYKADYVMRVVHGTPEAFED